MIACTGELVSNIEASNPGDVAIKLQAKELLSRDVFKKLDLPIKDDKGVDRGVQGGSAEPPFHFNYIHIHIFVTT